MILLSLLLIILASVFTKYDEDFAIQMVYVSALAYCPAARILTGKCGEATRKTTEFGIEVLHAMDKGSDTNSITYTVLKNDHTKQLFVAFSGTRDPTQLITEVGESFPTAYTIHPEFKDVKVMDYFYKFYLNDFREDYLQVISQAIQDYRNYEIIFTGHSLGGSMTVHAVADFILEGYGKNIKIQVYTYGQPRVGNYEFDNAYMNRVDGFYRVDHHRDIVPHIPP